MVGLMSPSLFAAFPRAELHELAFTVTFTDVSGEDRKGPEATRNILKPQLMPSPRKIRSVLVPFVTVFKLQL